MIDEMKRKEEGKINSKSKEIYSKVRERKNSFEIQSKSKLKTKTKLDLGSNQKKDTKNYQKIILRMLNKLPEKNKTNIGKD